VPITFTDRDTGDGPCIEVTRCGRVHGEIRHNPTTGLYRYYPAAILDQGLEDSDLDALKAAVTRYLQSRP
jgi:hypothetical protein